MGTIVAIDTFFAAELTAVRYRLADIAICNDSSY
jgi:hypothetical protein